MPLKPPQKQIKMDAKPPNRAKDDVKPRKPSKFTKKNDKFGRKRSQSFSGTNSKFCPPYKCRKRPMLPTKFLLGGNICDPLNLNSLQDEEINRTVNAITPKSSPVPTPPQRRGHVQVIIPPNIHDPLNLIDCSNDAEYEQQLTSPLKKGSSKRRKKKKRTSSATTDPSDADISASEAKMPDLTNDSAKIPEIAVTAAPPVGEASDNAPTEMSPPENPVKKVTRDLKLELSPPKDKKRKSDGHKDNNVKKIKRFESMDKIVSPVVPQPGAWLKRPLQFNRGAGPSGRGPHKPKTKDNGAEAKLPQFKDKNKAYQYGNYNRYYGYRNPNHDVDPRLRCFAVHQHIFENKDILDIGCNIGHITLSVARDFGAKSVVGIDIDKKLIGIARKNIRHYVNCYDSPRPDQDAELKLDKSDKFFPISMPILYGPVDIPGMQNEEVKGKGFPHNVTFVQGNYVLEDDSLLSTEHSQFDVILCLSITKWLHLNWGDGGLKQAFRRMYAQLRPGGKLIMEPQSWASYKHKKTLTKFTQYLLSSEVGFAKSEIMGHPVHTSKGFQRPIQVFTKSDLSPSQSQRSYSITPSHTITSAYISNKVYTSLTSPGPYNTPNNGELADKMEVVASAKCEGRALAEEMDASLIKCVFENKLDVNKCVIGTEEVVAKENGERLDEITEEEALNCDSEIVIGTGVELEVKEEVKTGVKRIAESSGEKVTGKRNKVEDTKEEFVHSTDVKEGLDKFEKSQEESVISNNSKEASDEIVESIEESVKSEDSKEEPVKSEESKEESINSKAESVKSKAKESMEESSKSEDLVDTNKDMVERKENLVKTAETEVKNNIIETELKRLMNTKADTQKIDEDVHKNEESKKCEEKNNRIHHIMMDGEFKKPQVIQNTKCQHLETSNLEQVNQICGTRVQSKKELDAKPSQNKRKHENNIREISPAKRKCTLSDNCVQSASICEKSKHELCTMRDCDTVAIKGTLNSNNRVLDIT